LKASCIKDQRLTPGARIALAMITGWAGKNESIETTMNIIAHHLGRSRRTILRYLQELEEFGYLRYCRTRSRIGYITGIRVYLNFGSVRHYYEDFLNRKRAEYKRQYAVTKTSQHLSSIIKDRKEDPEINQALVRMAQLLGFDYESTKGYG
jgi:predicted transcriptional regulator